MTKFLVLALSLACAAVSFARTCKTSDGLFELSMTAADEFQVQATLKFEDQEVTRVREFCAWTSGVRRVLRCPFVLADGTRVEIYPRYPVIGKHKTPAEKIGKPWDLTAPVIDAKIVFPNQEKAVLTCQD